MLTRPAEYERMAGVENVHWWYSALHRLVIDTIKDNFFDHSPSIIDTGCGTGGLIAFLKENGYGNVTGFDLSPVALAFCKKRRIPAFQGHLIDIDRFFSANTADIIVCNDVLYFLDAAEQATFLKKCHTVLKSNGLFIANLPAFQAFRGSHDLSVGILNRFTKQGFLRNVLSHQYQLVRATYWPFILAPAILFVRSWQRALMRRSPDFEVQSDIDLPPKMLNVLLEKIVIMENFIWARKPFGSSLFLVLRKRSYDGGSKR